MDFLGEKINVVGKWKDFFDEQESLLRKVEDNLKNVKNIRPDIKNIFRAFELTPFEKVSVVILGQDPYPQPNRADGLAFSFGDGKKAVYSLKNIFKKLKNKRTNTDLSDWANQGVLLINSVLTTEAGEKNIHKGKGWEEFIDNVFIKLSEDKKPKIFVLWGDDAQKKECFINNSLHKIIKSSHPSPLSVKKTSMSFENSKPFLEIEKKLPEIAWN